MLHAASRDSVRFGPDFGQIRRPDAQHGAACEAVMIRAEAASRMARRARGWLRRARDGTRLRASELPEQV